MRDDPFDGEMIMERRGFYVFEVDGADDEREVIDILSEAGLADVRVQEREYDAERIYITYEHTKPLPVNFSEILHERGVIV